MILCLVWILKQLFSISDIYDFILVYWNTDSTRTDDETPSEFQELGFYM